MGQAQLELVHHQRSIQRRREQLDLGGGVVADTEATYLAAGVQPVERRGHFFGLHEHVGSMQDQEIEVIHGQAFAACPRRVQDVVVARVVIDPRTGFVTGGTHHAALGLDDDAGAHRGVEFPDRGEGLLGSPVRIHVGQVEVIDAGRKRRLERSEGLLAAFGCQLPGFPRTCQGGAAIGEPAGLRAAASQLESLYHVAANTTGVGGLRIDAHFRVNAILV